MANGFKKRLVNLIKITVACETSGRQCAKFPGQMEEFHQQERTERSFSEFAASVRSIRRVHADLERGPWATTLHHLQNMADVAEQRHQNPQFDKGSSKNFWAWCNRQGGGADKAQGMLECWTTSGDPPSCVGVDLGGGGGMGIPEYPG